MASNPHFSQAWAYTSSEIYEALYAGLRTSLLNGARIAIRLAGRVYLLGNASHVRQGASTSEIYIRTERWWKLLDQDALNDLASTLNLISPQQHYQAVEKAIYDGYPVPKEIKADFATQSGIDRKAYKMSRKPQVTRAVDVSNHLIDDRQLYRPSEGDLVEYKLSGSSPVNLTISDIVSYRPFDGVWKVCADKSDQEFLIQRTVINQDPDFEDWHWSVYQRG